MDDCATNSENFVVRFPDVFDNVHSPLMYATQNYRAVTFASKQKQRYDRPWDKNYPEYSRTPDLFSVGRCRCIPSQDDCLRGGGVGEDARLVT